MNSQLSNNSYGIPLTPIPKFKKYMDTRINESIYLSDCSPNEIEKIIRELETGKASDICINIVIIYIGFYILLTE